ncbi:membrane protein [Desulfosarcina ovata subsp. ovata]|uniref:Membrane protein n=2 Tax=Desulfosarcina ovata TaxID=83564 RepID=A0A5K8A2V6_9BACT|nr:membrane protein [Desulfosarcina ovata subsp. ovata]
MATLVIFSASVFMPVIGFLFSMFIPLPVLFYRTKLGRRHGMIVPLVAIAVIGFIIGGITMDIVFFSGLMLLGFALSEMFEKALPVEMAIVAACGIVLGVGLGAMVMYSIASNTGVVSLVSAYVATNLKLSLQLYQSIGIPQETIDAISGSLDRIQYVLVRILPSLVAASTLFVAWTNLIAARPILERRGLAFPDYGRLNRWRAPDVLIWGVIGSGLIMLLPATGFRLIGINGLLVVLTVYFIQGIAIVSFFFEKKKLPRPIRVVLYIMIALQQLFLLVIVCIGLFDMWINFRKIDPDKREPDLPA